MVNRLSIQITAIFLLFFGYTYVQADGTASIKLTSETQHIYMGDSVILDIESTGLLEPLNIDVLKQRPDFLRETTGTRIAVIEGKVVEIAIRRMEFIPTQAGLQVFGPLTGEDSTELVRSNAISVDVQASLSTQWAPEDADLQGEIILSSKSPIVGEQIIADITLRHTHQIANERITMPVFAGFDALPVFEERRTIEGDGEWRQIAWRYLLHPKQSGDINIGSINWTGTIIKSRTQRGEFIKTLSHPVLQVNSAPEGRPDWWLPATSVKLSDVWSEEVTNLSAGDEIIRTITLTASNVLARQLPDIAPYPTRALTSTLIRTTRDHELINDHTVATATFEYRMVAQSPIPVFLDTVRVPWWNVGTNTHEEAILPARRINVGLPDRADLLADLAFEQSNWSRLIFRLRSYARWQPVIILVSVVLLFLALLPVLRDGIHQHRFTSSRRKSLRTLEKLRENQNWSGLYNELNQPNASEHALKTDSLEYQSLIRALQHVLFENTKATTSTTKDATAAVLHRKIRLPFLAPLVKKRHVRIGPL